MSATKHCMGICTYYELYTFKTKRHSTSKILTNETFCIVCLYLAKKCPSATLSASSQLSETRHEGTSQKYVTPADYIYS
jgi:hypothetical protein